MGGVTGAVSTKIVVQAGLLLIAARIDRHPVQATIDPAAPQTRLATALARRLNGADEPSGMRAIHGYHAVGIDRHEVRLRRVAPAAADAPVPLLIGNDLLREAPIELDFAGGRLRLLEPRDVAKAARGLARIAVAVAPSGCVEMAGTLADGAPATVALAPSRDAPAATVTVRFGGFSLDASPPVAGRCSAGAATLGWGAFAGRRMILDLPDGLLWVSPAA